VVASVDQPAEPAQAVDGESPLGRIDRDADETVSYDDFGRIALDDRHGIRELLGLGRLPTEARDVRHSREHALCRGLVESNPHDGIRMSPEPGIEILLNRRDRNVVALLASEADRDVDACLVLGHRHALYPRVSVDLAAVGQHSENGPHGWRVECQSTETARYAERPGLLRQPLGVRGGGIARQHYLDRSASGVCRGINHHRPRFCQRPRKRLQGLFGETVSYLTGFGVALEHGIGHVVDGARAHRVVGSIPDHLRPSQLEQARGPLLGRQEESAQGLRPLLEGSLGFGHPPPDVDSVRGHAHEHVRPRARAQLSSPGGQVLRDRPFQIRGKRRDFEVELVL